jgi:hypothetical protein
MGKSQNFFRYIWRINAVLILVAAGSITLVAGSIFLDEFRSRTQRQPETGIAVVAQESSSHPVHPQLGRAEIVPGTGVMRAVLSVDGEGTGKGFGSSGGSTETRNILFIEGGQKAAHWLLPDKIT